MPSDKIANIKNILQETVKGASSEEIDELREVLYYAKKKAKGKHFSGYIGNEYLPYIPIVLDYLYDKGIIKRKSYYSLATFAVQNLVTTLIQQIRKSQKTPENTKNINPSMTSE